MGELIESQQVLAEREEKPIVESIVSVMTLLAMLVLPCSVVFDWAYFSRLGLNMSQVPTSLSDHARSAVIWAPAFGFALLGAVLQHVINRRMDDWRDPSEVRREKMETAAHSNFVIRWLTWLFFTPSVFILSAVAVSVCSFLWSGSEYYGAMLFMLGLGWILAATKVLPDNAEWVRKFGLLIALGPVIAAAAYVAGDRRAIENLKESPSATIVLSNKEQLSKLVLLRYLDRGVLVKKPDEHLMFVQWSAIAEIDDARARMPFEGFGCKWFGRCDDVKRLRYQPVQ